MAWLSHQNESFNCPIGLGHMFCARTQDFLDGQKAIRATNHPQKVQSWIELLYHLSPAANQEK